MGSGARGQEAAVTRCSAITRGTHYVAAHPCEHDREIKMTKVGKAHIPICAFHRASRGRGDRVVLRPVRR